MTMSRTVIVAICLGVVEVMFFTGCRSEYGGAGMHNIHEYEREPMDVQDFKPLQRDGEVEIPDADE